MIRQRGAFRLFSSLPGLLAGVGLTGFFALSPMNCFPEDLSKRTSSPLVQGQGMERGKGHRDKSDDLQAQLHEWKIVRVYPHDPTAFTQGLVFSEGRLFESTGIRAKSTLREVELETGRILKSRSLDPECFGEGLTLWEDRLIQLTWQSGTGLVWNKDMFHLEKVFHYEGEGWGITHNGQHLIMSDGSATLRFLDPKTFEKARSVVVRDRGESVEQLNELEWINGEIVANIWGQDRIARISPASGQVLGWIDLSALRNALGPVQGPDALNGIAYDPERDRIFITGKLWPRLFEIQLCPQ